MKWDSQDNKFWPKPGAKGYVSVKGTIDTKALPNVTKVFVYVGKSGSLKGPGNDRMVDCNGRFGPVDVPPAINVANGDAVVVTVECIEGGKTYSLYGNTTVGK
jgi:hypothetical protein